MANRIIRGFSRVGIGAAVLVAIGGIVATGFVARDRAQRAAPSFVLPDAEAALVPDFEAVVPEFTPSFALSDAKAGLVSNFEPDKPYDFYQGGKWWHHDPATGDTLGVGGGQPRPGFVIDQPPSPAVAEAEEASTIGLGLSALAALAVFGFFRGLGWVIAGFAKD